MINDHGGEDRMIIIRVQHCRALAREDDVSQNRTFLMLSVGVAIYVESNF